MGEYRSYPQYEVISACDGAFEMLNAPMPGEKLVWRYDDTYCIFPTGKSLWAGERGKQ